MHDPQSSTKENAEGLASFLDPRFRIASELPTVGDLSGGGQNRHAECGHFYG